MTHFQTDEAKAAQQAALDEIVNTKIPNTTDLETKYPVTYPTTVDTDMGKKFKAPFIAILIDGTKVLMLGVTGPIRIIVAI